ncbi:hypothetical protein [Pseudobacteriovorax antillogorgiicola]|uniref:Uncharacterized protein n=1 Tax=Pseudobacteriovorax antillogorgiicola TaxID=1513793 RepID=A0A1Y6B5X4_9BACT|nr:hypothetical protein [Pseudobacteriovorax antillogorgiicola]TCS59117.1 hypothetical protein EDD56_10120 [Pseudobacteriovorax antillogorgiicola]SME91644.1 hypothetical protein SAMN06296036_101466 [Pseudobacteriovorax antillogorgiicola]
METSQTHENSIKLTSTEDGIHLDGSILWLDSKHTGDISFLSNPQSATSKLDSRVIATEETIRILESFRKKPKALICQYNRPFAIGPLNMELLPSGVGLGGASLWVETNNKKILYAPQLQPQNSETCHHMQVRKADILILSAKTPYNADANISRKREKERLIETIKKMVSANERPQIFCEPYATGPEITKILSEEGINVAVHPNLFRILKVYEAYGSHVGSYIQHSIHRGDYDTLLKPIPQNKQLRRVFPKNPVISIEDNQGPRLDDGLFRKIDERFYIPSSCDGRELKTIVPKIKPREIYIFGPYAKDYVRQLRSLAPVVKALFPRHLPSLF